MRPKSPTNRPVSRSKLESVSTAALRLKTPVYVSQPALRDDQASALFEEWLQLPLSDQASEDELAQGLEQKYATDHAFNTSDIYASDVPAEVREALGPVIWRRVTGQLYIPSRRRCKLVQGCIADHRWFLGALAAVACKQELLLDLVVSDEQAAKGIYTFRFFKHGQWCPVLVDNRLPCLELQQRLAFSSSGQAQELWPSLIEKAYAKLHGGYPALAKGSVANALVDLTGGVLACKVNLSQEAEMADAATGLLWSQISDWLAAGSIIVCTVKQRQDGPAASSLMSGITPDSPYSILAAKKLRSGTMLLQLHCPWSPEGMWQGPWSAGSAEWQSDEGQTMLAYDDSIAASLEDPSVFWCSYWDFIQVFNRCWVLQLLPDSWHQIRVAGGWVGATAGGPATPQTTPTSEGNNTMAFSLTGALDHITTLRSAAGASQAGHEANNGWQGTISTAVKSDTQSQHQRQLPRAGVPVSVSSSWCCNPQFRLTAAGNGQVVVCLGQRDLQVRWWCTGCDLGSCSQRCCTKDTSPSNSGHQPKQQRDFEIGLLVLHDRAWSAARTINSLSAMSLRSSRSPSPVGRSRTSSSASPNRKHLGTSSHSPARPSTAAVAAAGQLGRIWVPQQCVIVDSGLSSSREVVVRFRVEQGESYTLVPYTRQAGDTRPFVMRVYSPHAMQLEQLPSPLSLVIGGQWAGHLAGGRSCHHQSWGSNPQYLISCQRETTAIIALLRPDVCNSLLPQPYDPRQCIGVTICTPQVTAEGLGRRAAVWDAAAEVHAESDFTVMDEAVLLVQLQPETPYLLVPSTAEPGVEAPFELRLLSSQPIELVPLPEVHTISHKGEWDASSAGGCNIHSSWTSNPAYLLRLQRRSVCKITVTRSSGKWSRNQPLGEMLGFYIIKQPAVREAPHKSTQTLKHHQLFESVFVPAAACEAELELPADTPLLLVPCTYAPHIQGSFCATVTAKPAAGMVFEPVAGGLAAAVAPSASGAKETVSSHSGSGVRPVTPSFPGQLIAQGAANPGAL